MPNERNERFLTALQRAKFLKLCKTWKPFSRLACAAADT